MTERELAGGRVEGHFGTNGLRTLLVLPEPWMIG